MKSILKRVQFYCLGLAAILAAVLAFPALAAEPAKVKKMTFWHPGAGITVVEKSKGKALALPKLTVNTVNTCQAVNMGPEYTETPTTVTTYIFVAPAPCTTAPNTGIWFNGALENLWPVGIAGGVSYFRATFLAGEPANYSLTGYVTLGDEVFVTAPNQLQVKLANEIYTVYLEDDTFIKANVAKMTASGDRRTLESCAGGCSIGTESLLWVMALDKAAGSDLGAVVSNHMGEMVGVFIGNDRGMSIVISVNGITHGAQTLGINLSRKG